MFEKLDITLITIGDSLVRHATQAMNALLEGNLLTGGVSIIRLANIHCIQPHPIVEVLCIAFIRICIYAFFLSYLPVSLAPFALSFIC